MARIYLASSWRNEVQPAVVERLRAEGHAVYDFRNPPNGTGGFKWADIDPDWESWSPERYRALLLAHPIAAQGYLSDFRGMAWCDTCLLVMPCGRSAHLELGWCAGAGKRTMVLLADGEPELMTLMADDLCLSLDEVVERLRDGGGGAPQVLGPADELAVMIRLAEDCRA
jgi:hypothetical protein